MARVTRAVSHLSAEEVKQRLKHDARPWCRQRWLIIYNALVEPRWSVSRCMSLLLSRLRSGG